MALIGIYSHDIRQRYKVSICSTATFLYLLISIFTILAPLFIAFWTQGFWLKEATYREQPEVHFTHEFIFLAEGNAGTTYLGFSTFQNFNYLLDSMKRLSFVKSYEADDNRDGKADNLNFEIEMPLSNVEEINSVKLILLFDYKLHRHSTVHMQTMAFINHESPASGSEFHVTGVLSLDQRYPVPSRGIFSVYNNSVIDGSSAFADAYNLENIFSTYAKRNLSTRFKPLYPLWKSGRAEDQPFLMKVNMIYPEEVVIYRPGFWHVIKMAWIQYLSILVIFIYVFGFLKRLLFENQLVVCVPQVIKVAHS